MRVLATSSQGGAPLFNVRAGIYTSGQAHASISAKITSPLSSTRGEA
jgi:hypothetical protein